MSTEEWGAGYDEGYMKGWNDAMDEMPVQRKPLTHEQRLDVLAKFEKHKMKWDDSAILIDLVEAAHGIKEQA